MVNKKYFSKPNKNIILMIIGLYFILDGAISFYHFRYTATSAEQFFRVIRTIIGFYIFYMFK